MDALLAVLERRNVQTFSRSGSTIHVTFFDRPPGPAAEVAARAGVDFESKIGKQVLRELEEHASQRFAELSEEDEDFYDENPEG